MARITPSLWFDGNAEEAANFYVSLLPDSQVDHVARAAAANPSTPAGGVMSVEFTLAGQQFRGINGGPQFHFTEAVSFAIDCADQTESDRLWNALTADGGEEGMCGWLKDRFGLSWQVIPRQLVEMLGSDDREGARRAMEAMLQMHRIDVGEMRRAFEGVPARR